MSLNLLAHKRGLYYARALMVAESNSCLIEQWSRVFPIRLETSHLDVSRWLCYVVTMTIVWPLGTPGERYLHGVRCIDTDDVMYLLNRYFAQVGELIERNDGYIDKFVGDGLMAIFGVGGRADAPILSAAPASGRGVQLSWNVPASGSVRASALNGITARLRCNGCVVVL